MFVDLGSGVGQVCMMMSALSNASRCFGIEIMDHPARYAVQLLSRFQSLSQEHAVNHAPIELVHGDFLTNSAVRDAVSAAGLVYINNPKFGPELNLKILNKLCPLMPKGCKLICFDSLIRPGYFNDFLTHQKILEAPEGSVSWKHSGVDLHVLERAGD
jgi:H3 lysine-79-specific histone-lysine N-methyltransferase